VNETRPPPEPEPESAKEPEEAEPEPDRPLVKPRPKPAIEEPPDPEPPAALIPEEKPPEDAPEEKPVFDLGDNTFATGEGQTPGWSLNRSEGNTKFAAVAAKNDKPVRGTKPLRSPDGKPGGKGLGFAPISVKDLSKRPMPIGGSIKSPPYPTEARREGIEGAVVLQVFIDKKGRVRRVRIIKDPGGGLGEVSRTAMSNERWTVPRDKSGNPVDTVIIYSYRFVLEG
jgi:outer membrane biosynthesis protein TonB